jgi:putative endonuclease
MFFVYILKCSDNTLYTGFTIDIEKRLQTHRSGLGSKYVRARLPVEIIYKEEFDNQGDAMRREIEIKKWSRKKKIEILKLEE